MKWTLPRCGSIPEGWIGNSPTFQRWVREVEDLEVPKGRLNRANHQPSLRDLPCWGATFPTLKRWAIFASPFGRNVALGALCLASLVTPVRGAETEDFPYTIQPELGATEFAPGDSIVITVFRGDRQ